jgi:serine/threonine protein kinase
MSLCFDPVDDDEKELRKILYQNGFIIQHQIGGGGTAVVYSVESWKFGGLYAVKLFQLSTFQDASILDSFTAEVNALSHLSHPNVIKFFSYFRSPSYLYLVLEYCARGSVKDVLKRFGPISAGSLVSVALDLIRALEYCHSRNVAHRDIKPGNILIDEYDHYKFADFGLATKLAERSLISEFGGSLAYMAPEVLEHRPFDPLPADIWSLGVTFFEMAVGRSPWMCEDTAELKSVIIRGKFTIPDNVDGRFADALRKMIVVDPTGRATAAQLQGLDVFTQAKGMTVCTRPARMGWRAVPRVTPRAPPARAGAVRHASVESFTRISTTLL